MCGGGGVLLKRFTRDDFHELLGAWHSHYFSVSVWEILAYGASIWDMLVYGILC